MTNWAAAQAVQNSAFRDGSNYRRNDTQAIAIRKALWADVAPGTHLVDHATHTGPTIHVVVAGDTLFDIADGWGVTLHAVEAANPQAGHPAGNFASIRPGDRIAHP